MSDILVRPPQLRETASQIRNHAKTIQASLTQVDSAVQGLNPQQFDGMRSEALRSHYQSKRDALLKMDRMVTRFAAELEQIAATFEEADKRLGQGQAGEGTGVPKYVLVDGKPVDFEAWRKQHSWRIVQTAGHDPILISGDGRQIDLAALRNRDPNAEKAYGEYLGEYAEAYGVMGEIAKGKWTSVNGYMTQAGTAVDSYWRSLPGGKALGEAFESAGWVISAADVGSSVVQALTDKEGNEWISVPLCKVGDQDVFYTYYLPKKDHWREATTKIGGVLGGLGGGAVAGLVGAPSGPADVVVTIAGSTAGSSIGEEAFGAGYDALFHPQVVVPPRPATDVTGQVAPDSVSISQNENVNQIDVAQMVDGQNGAATLEYTIDENGQPHLSYIVTPTF